MSIVLQHLLCLLALLAMGHAQVFGLSRNHMYFADGVAIVTVADHHHKGHGLHCGLSHDFIHQHERDDYGGHDDDDPEDSIPLRVDLSAPHLAGPISAPVPRPLFAVELPDFLVIPEASTPDVLRCFEAPPDVGVESRLPASLLVVRFAVLLV